MRAFRAILARTVQITTEEKILKISVVEKRES